MKIREMRKMLYDEVHRRCNELEDIYDEQGIEKDMNMLNMHRMIAEETARHFGGGILYALTDLFVELLINRRLITDEVLDMMLDGVKVAMENEGMLILQNSKDMDRFMEIKSMGWNDREREAKHN